MRRISFLILILFFGLALHAQATGIDSTNKYAYGENIGWLNLGTTEGNVQVGNTSSTGYIWTENTGWVSLNCSNTSSCGSVNYGVTNDGSGNLSGYAWGENVGWISFSCANTSSCGSVNYGVTVDSISGDFSGFAYGENSGWVSFNCANTSSCGSVSYKVSLGNASSSNNNNNNNDSVGSSGGGGGDSGNGGSDEELPPPSHSMFPSERPPKFTPPPSSQIVQIIQPGQSGEAVSRFIIPAQIAAKIKLIWQLSISSIEQGAGNVGNFVSKFWNSIWNLFKPSSKNNSTSNPAPATKKRNYGAIDLYTLINGVKEVPELLPPGHYSPAAQAIQTGSSKRVAVDPNQLQGGEKLQIIWQIMRTLKKPTSTQPNLMPMPALVPPIPKPKTKTQIKAPNPADVLDSLQSVINMLQTGGH